MLQEPRQPGLQRQLSPCPCVREQMALGCEYHRLAGTKWDGTTLVSLVRGAVRGVLHAIVVMAGLRCLAALWDLGPLLSKVIPELPHTVIGPRFLCPLKVFHS